MHHYLLPLLLIFTIGACASAGASRLTPADSALVASDGTDVSLAEVWQQHPATVLVWWSSSCPCVARYRERIEALAATWAPRDVAVYLVASNADDGPDVIARAAHDSRLPILRDPGGALAMRLGIISTPSVVLLDRAGGVRYRGWLDNEHTPGDPEREAWLDDALTSLLARPDAPAGIELKPVWGCTVTRSLATEKTCRSPVPTAVAEPTHHCGGK